MRRHAMGLTAALLTLWGAGSVFNAAAGYKHLILQGIIGLWLLVAAGWLWARWWKTTGPLPVSEPGDLGRHAADDSHRLLEP